MRKANNTVLTETKFIGVVVIALSVVMQLVFVLLSKWDYKVLLSNVYSAIVVVLNFYLMGLSVMKAVDKEEKEAQKIMKTSLTLRTFGLFVAITLGVVLPCFNVIATVIPLFFPRIAITLRPLFKNYNAKEEGDKNELEKNSV